MSAITVGRAALMCCRLIQRISSRRLRSCTAASSVDWVIEATGAGTAMASPYLGALGASRGLHVNAIKGQDGAKDCVGDALPLLHRVESILVWNTSRRAKAGQGACHLFQPPLYVV